jgi:hypothetical protein
MGRHKKPFEMSAITSRIIEEGSCHIWQGYLGNGVPMVFYGGAMKPVRLVISYLLKKNTPEKGYWSSKCLNKLCVNPAHSVHRNQEEHMAYLGSCILNTPAKNELRKLKISNSRRKITDEQLDHIISSEKTCKAIADDVGISKGMVARYRRAKAGKSQNFWKGLMK